jgi:hypothetical protein
MRVFLSHASESKPLVRTIAAHFPPHVEVWIDVNELSTGAPLPENIESAIDYECDYVIVFVEANALASDWVRREVGMALRRERDLKRPFLLPVLLEPLADQLPRLGELGERIHFDATDSTPAGLQRAGELLCGELFALASRLIEGLRSTGRHQMLAEFARDLNAFKQAAFLWIGELANPLAVLSANLPAFEKLRDAIADYNRVADPFIAGLNVHRQRISAAWASYRGLTQDFRDLTEFVENGVYRGALFKLNEVHAMIHELDATGGADAARMATQEARRDELLDHARDALQTLTRRSTQVIAELEREI